MALAISLTDDFCRWDRPQFLRDACGGDDALQREVESLLTYASDAQKFMDEGPRTVLFTGPSPGEEARMRS